MYAEQAIAFASAFPTAVICMPMVGTYLQYAMVAYGTTGLGPVIMSVLNMTTLGSVCHSIGHRDMESPLADGLRARALHVPSNLPFVGYRAIERHHVASNHRICWAQACLSTSACRRRR